MHEVSCRNVCGEMVKEHYIFSNAKKKCVNFRVRSGTKRERGYRSKTGFVGNFELGYQSGTKRIIQRT